MEAVCEVSGPTSGIWNPGMLRLFREASRWVDAFRKSRGGTRRISVSVRLDPDKALAAFKKLTEAIKERIWK